MDIVITIITFATNYYRSIYYYYYSNMTTIPQRLNGLMVGCWLGDCRLLEQIIISYTYWELYLSFDGEDFFDVLFLSFLYC